MGTENRVKESKVVSKVNADNNDEYDPFAARNSTQKNSDFTVFMHLLKASIGSGILFLPHAFSRAGYVSALMCSIVIGLISCHTAILTVQCSQILCKRIQKPSMDLAEIASTSFKFGPEKIRKYAVSLNVVTNILVCFIQYETAIIYSLYVASSTQQIVKIVVTLSIICSYGLHYYVPVNILWPMISRKITRRHYLYEVIFRLGGVITTTIIAAAIPQMTPLLGLLTAICMTTMMLLLPAIIELMTKWYDKDSLPLFYYRWTKDILIIIVWLIMLVFGVSENLKDIIEAYGDTKNVNSTNSC
ncbi:hypothetical protein PV325_010510 [Microctonus aethiopoides]|nr:hypothetical protein PV325_010510 [Microctonus aethiopoides]